MGKAKHTGVAGRVRLGMALAVLAMWLCAPIAGAARGAPQPPKPAAQDGFVPIDQLAPKEELPATPLVMTAYAVAWLVPFVYVWSIARRLNKVEAEIADVTRRIASGPPR
jgi:CcmD family protein